jgi:hypothetical protein
MDVENINSNHIHLLNSDENILKVLEQSNTFLKSRNDLSSTIEEILWIFRALEDLIPQTLENFWSGHIFPLVESNSDLENSIQLCKLGFYKSAIVTLRNVLELGLLSVYWDINDNSHIDIQKWFRASEKTPFKKTVFVKLKTNQNIMIFDSKHNIFKNIDILFKQLSDFTHSRGHYHSNQELAKSNTNRFNEQAFLKWFELMTNVIQFVVSLHILKYPVALQYTPIDQKFGMNGPVGLFLQPSDTKRIRNFLDNDILKTLQEISDADPTAQSLREWVEEQPDISNDELQEQIKYFEQLRSTKPSSNHQSK